MDRSTAARVRSALALLAILLLPSALATHGGGRDLTNEVEGGSSVILAVEASGSIVSAGEGRERKPASLEEATHRSRWTYSWGGTIQLDLRADGLLSGDAQLTGGGQGSLLDHMHSTIYDYEGAVENEIDTEKRCEPRTGMFNNGKLHARGMLDRNTGELIVLVASIGERDFKQDCVWENEGFTETSSLYPPPPLSPLVIEGMRLVAAGDARVKLLDPNLDEPNAANALLFSVPLASGHTILRGGASAAIPVSSEVPLGKICPTVSDSQIIKGTCTAAGTLNVRVIVDPCPLAKASRDVHLAAVKALQQPAKGSSESQVRAFSVDARQKIVALLADERVLQLLCTDEGDAASLAAVMEATTKAADAWADVARTHGLSDEGKRDFVAAERSRQLAGGGDASAENAATLGEILVPSSGADGAISIKAHSPVALHAWDETGRHVGWNESAKRADVQVEGANYTGEPGGAQELTLPSGFYKVAVVELDAGHYTLNNGWNGTAGDGVELLPLTSAKGRTLVANYLLDHQGLLVGPTQRIATNAAPTFTFVEEWSPLALATPEIGTTAGGAPDSGADSESGAGSGAGSGGARTPGPGAILVGTALLGTALMARRRSA